ncbi:hypothetical protein AB0D12_40900, partial [Streptomyces sp. NPDC048479]
MSESWFYKWRDKPATARETRRQRLADEIKRIPAAPRNLISSAQCCACRRRERRPWTSCGRRLIRHRPADATGGREHAVFSGRSG